MKTIHLQWYGLLLGFVLGGVLPMFWGAVFISYATFIGAVIGGMVGVCLVILATTW